MLEEFALGIQSPCQRMIGVTGLYDHLLSKVFRFHETILRFGEPGSLALEITKYINNL